MPQKERTTGSAAFLHLPSQKRTTDSDQTPGPIFSVLPGLQRAIDHYAELEGLDYPGGARRLFGLGDDLAEALVRRLFPDWCAS